METPKANKPQFDKIASYLQEFSAQQTSQFMEVIDACHSLHTEAEFQDMIRGPLRALLPHKYAAAGIGERGKLVIDYTINIDFPETYLERVIGKRASKSFLNSPVARDWADTPKTRFVTGLKQLNPDYHEWTNAVKKYHIDNMLVSGLHDLIGSKTSYFCFACCDESNPALSQYLMDLITPHLHKAITHVSHQNETASATQATELSSREVEVLRLVGSGMTNVDIGKKLFISENTVKNHVQSIFKKLHVANRVQAVSRAYTLKLIADDAVA
jgi:transcriptional regulator EpsA